jgi:hypothetical protein
MEPICVQGRRLSGDDLAAVRVLIEQHSDWHRTALSRHLCELWNWRNGAGRLKDMAAHAVELQARGDQYAAVTRTARRTNPAYLPAELLCWPLQSTAAWSRCGP